MKTKSNTPLLDRALEQDTPILDTHYPGVDVIDPDHSNIEKLKPLVHQYNEAITKIQVMIQKELKRKSQQPVDPYADLTDVMEEDISRSDNKPGFESAAQDKQYHGNWIND